MRENDRFLFLKADGKTVVEETDPEIHILKFLPGKMISDQDERRYDFSELDGPEEPDVEPAKVESADVKVADVKTAAIEKPPRTTAVEKPGRNRKG